MVKTKNMKTNQTNTQLKQALAKMLPEKLYIINGIYQQFVSWSPGGRIPVLDTELLHLCWLVEETLTPAELTDFGCELVCLIMPPKSATPHWGMLAHATWQQRTIALCKVKGIDI